MAPKSTPEARRDELRRTMFEIVAREGLDRLTVREVAAAAGVAIGTIQHYFASKDAMLQAAFEEVVRRTRDRLQSVRLGPDPRRNLEAVLGELLPLDEARSDEARVQLAFSARAAVAPALAAQQEQILAEIRDGLSEAFVAAGQSARRAAVSAQIALATVDGLAQHAASTPATSDWLPPALQRKALRSALDALLAR